MKQTLRNTLVLSLTTILIVGCGGDKEADLAAPGFGKRVAAGDSTADPDESVTSPDPGSASPTSPADLAKSIAALTEEAQDAEAKFEFEKAASAWGKIVQQLEGQYGKGAWQVANAKLAYDVAITESGFDDQQKQKLRKIANIQNQLVDAMKINNFFVGKKLAKDSNRLTAELFGERSPLFGKQLIQTAHLQMRAAEPAEAIQSFQHALSILSESFHANHPDLCDALDQTGAVYLEQENFAQAMSYLKAATKMAASIWGEDSPQYAKRANDLGVAFYQNGDYETATKVLQAAEVIRRQKLGGQHPLVGHSLLNMATVHIDEKDYATAITQLTQAREIFNVAGEEHADRRIQTEEKLATAYMFQNQPEMAEPILRLEANRLAGLHPNGHADLAVAQYRLAIAMARQGKYESAEPLLKDALTTQQTVLGESHSQTVKTMRAYSLLLQRTERPDLAQQMQERIRIATQQQGDTRIR